MKFGYEGVNKQVAAKGWMGWGVRILTATISSPVIWMDRIIYSKCSVKDYSYGFIFRLRFKKMGGN